MDSLEAFTHELTARLATGLYHVSRLMPEPRLGSELEPEHLKRFASGFRALEIDLSEFVSGIHEKRQEHRNHG